MPQLLDRLAGRLKDRHQIMEVAMPATQHPSKHLVRAYLERRARDPKPPPTPEEIRRQLGWGMPLPGFKMETGRS
jgi:hypothetical protein